MDKTFLLALDKLLIAGQMCSNCCYNLKHKTVLYDFNRKSMIESYIAWDKAVDKVNEERRKIEIIEINNKL